MVKTRTRPVPLGQSLLTQETQPACLDGWKSTPPQQWVLWPRLALSVWFGQMLGQQINTTWDSRSTPPSETKQKTRKWQTLELVWMIPLFIFIVYPFIPVAWVFCSPKELTTIIARVYPPAPRRLVRTGPGWLQSLRS